MAEPRPVIDVCGLAFDADGWAAYLGRFARQAPRYLEVFARPLTRAAGADLDTYLAAFAVDPARAVDVLARAGGLATTADEHVAALEAQGVRLQVLMARPDRLPDGSTSNERIAQWAVRHPDRLRAWVGVDLDDVDAALAELEHGVGDLAMSGVNVIPFLDGSDPSSPQLRPFFDRVAQLDVPVWIHAGQHFGRPSLGAWSWWHLDALAGTHPDVTFIAGHGGWPWVLEMVALAQRHPNLYLELSSHRGRHLSAPGSGWEPLLAHGRTTIRHKVLFGSTSWVSGLSVRDLAEEVAHLPIGDDAVAAWLYDNATASLRLPVPESVR